VDQVKRSGFNRPRYGQKTRRDCYGGCKEDGKPRSHDSIEEAEYCCNLERLKKAGEILSYRGQVVYHLKDRVGKPCGFMRVDFEVIRADGTMELHEYKGKLFATLMEYRTKRALFSWCHPEITYITVQKGQIVYG
jgi:hypothetical protein